MYARKARFQIVKRRYTSMGFSDAFSALGGIFGQVKSSGSAMGEMFSNISEVIRRT